MNEKKNSLAHKGDGAILARQQSVERRVLGSDDLGDVDAGLGESLFFFFGGGRRRFLSRGSRQTSVTISKKKASTEARLRNSCATTRRRMRPALHRDDENSVCSRRWCRQRGRRGYAVSKREGPKDLARHGFQTDAKKRASEREQEKRNHNALSFPARRPQPARIFLHSYLRAGGREDDHEQGAVRSHGELRGCVYLRGRGGRRILLGEEK